MPRHSFKVFPPARAKKIQAPQFRYPYEYLVFILVKSGASPVTKASAPRHARKCQVRPALPSAAGPQGSWQRKSLCARQVRPPSPVNVYKSRKKRERFQHHQCRSQCSQCSQFRLHYHVKREQCVQCERVLLWCKYRSLSWQQRRLQPVLVEHERRCFCLFWSFGNLPRLCRTAQAADCVQDCSSLVTQCEFGRVNVRGFP